MAIKIISMQVELNKFILIFGKSQDFLSEKTVFQKEKQKRSLEV